MAANSNEKKMQIILYDSLQILFHQVPPSTELANIITEDVFTVPNKKAFILLMNYLLHIIDANKFKVSISKFESKSSLLYERSQDLQYRNTISTHIKEINKMYPEARIPFVTPSHMIHGGGPKIVELMLKLSLLCLTIIANKKLGSSTVNEWCPSLPCSVNNANQRQEKSKILVVLQEKQAILQEKICKAEKERLERQEEIKSKLHALQNYRTQVHNSVQNMNLPNHLRERLGEITDQSVLPEIKQYIKERRGVLEDNAVQILGRVHRDTNVLSHIFPDGITSVPLSLQDIAKKEVQDVFIPLIRTVSCSNSHLRKSLNSIRKTKIELDEFMQENLEIYSSEMRRLLQSEEYSKDAFNSSFTNSSVTLSPVHNLNISPLEVAVSCPDKFRSEKRTTYEFPLSYFSSPCVNIKRNKQSAMGTEKKRDIRKEKVQPLRSSKFSLPVYVEYEDDFPKYDEQLKKSVADVLNMSLSEEESQSPNMDSGLGSHIFDFQSSVPINSMLDVKTNTSKVTFAKNAKKVNQVYSVSRQTMKTVDEIPLNESSVARDVFTTTNSDTPLRKPRKSLEALKSRLEAVKRQSIVNINF